jgi:tRNA nucleotidyltransferase (CCA-adding enzyme)
MTVKLYEVGGSIRDELLGLSSSDKDYVAVCDGGWGELLRWSTDVMDKVFLVTPEYFTIRGKLGDDVMDIVMARKDGVYSDGRHPDKVEPGNLFDDLKRREFTVNAMGRCVKTGELFDPHNGKQDIEDRVIRCVGSAEERLSEDALRVLRALRFFVTKGLRLDESISKIIRTDVIPLALGGRISTLIEKNVSRDRVREELYKMFKHDSMMSTRILFDDRMVHEDLRIEIFGTDIWLKPTTESR